MTQLTITIFISILLIEIVWLALNNCFTPFSVLAPMVVGVVIGHVIWTYITYLKKKRDD